jgi:hypothetical protein
MRAYKRVRTDDKLHEHLESASIASTDASAPSEVALVELKSKLKQGLNEPSRSPVKVPKLCLASLGVERNVSCKSASKVSRPEAKRKSPAAHLLRNSSSTRSFDLAKVSEAIPPASTKPKVLSKVRSTVISRARSPMGWEKSPSRHEGVQFRTVDLMTKVEVMRRQKTQHILSQCSIAERILIEEPNKVEVVPLGMFDKLPQEIELIGVLNQLSVRKVQDVKDSLRLPEAIEIGFSMLILFADVDNSIEVTCSHRVFKSRRWEQVSNYFSVPGHVVSVCRRFIPNVKKGLVSLNAVQQASDHIAQVKRVRDQKSAYALLQAFIVKAIKFFEAWQQQRLL